MTVPQFALLTVVTLVGTGTALATTPPSDAAHYDAAYTVLAFGDQPLSAGPNAYSSTGRTSEDFGDARSADGRLVVGWGHAAAGDGHADAVATDVRMLGGAVRAAAVIAHCRHGAATSWAVGVVGEVNGEATVAYDVRNQNRDGSTTVVGMQIRVHSGHGTVINVASATCAPRQDQPNSPRPVAGLAQHTADSSVVAGDRSRTQPSSFGVVTQTGTVSAGS